MTSAGAVRAAAPLLREDRTVERRAVRLGDPRDNPATARPLAPQPFTIVDCKGVLEIPQPSVGLPMIAQGGASHFECFLKYVADRSRQRGGGAGPSGAVVGEDIGGPRPTAHV